MTDPTPHTGMVLAAGPVWWTEYLWDPWRSTPIAIAISLALFWLPLAAALLIRSH